MSYCQQERKDQIILVTKEDHEISGRAELVASDTIDPYKEHGLVLPNGEINWNCTCLWGMARSSCGEQFKRDFSCFHCGTEDIKGSDCVDQFQAMQEYPNLDPQEDKEEATEEKPLEHAEEMAPTEATATEEESASI